MHNSHPSSLSRLARALAVLLGAVLISTMHAQERVGMYHLQSEILVTASRIPTTFGHVNRTVEVIDKEQIRQSPAESVAQLLDTALGIDVRQQGPLGVQADASIRGATYEQTLILVDGVKVTDPQTGHHNLNLPVNIQEIERIEVLKGPGSRLFGPNAFGGVINIITAEPEGHQAHLVGQLAEDQTYEGLMMLAAPAGPLRNRVAFSMQGSDGYRENTESKKLTLSYRGAASLGRHSLDLHFGYTDKEFGANRFYGSTSELQWEETKTIFASSRLHFTGERLSFTPGIFWRQHQDHYIWNREHPEWYENRHTTNLYGLDSQIALNSKLGNTAIGGEISAEKIESNNLGNHSRAKTGVFVEHDKVFFSKLRLNLGASSFYYSDWGWQVWPGADLGYELGRDKRVYVSYGQAFRAPSYTELYYSDPNSRGNSQLTTEENWTLEAGYRFVLPGMQGHAAVFKRQSNNLIDWVWSLPDSVWNARNITELSTNGFEAELNYRFPSHVFGNLRLGYTYLDSDKNVDGLSSKYSINHFKHQLIAGLDYQLFTKRLTQNWIVRFEDRLQFDQQLLIDTRLTWQFDKISLFLDVSNLLNSTYNEFLLFPMPGRKFRTGFITKLAR